MAWRRRIRGGVDILDRVWIESPRMTVVDVFEGGFGAVISSESWKTLLEAIQKQQPLHIAGTDKGTHAAGSGMGHHRTHDLTPSG